VKRRTHDLQISVARRLAALRQARSMTQEGVADRLNIASQNIQRIESGRQNLTLQTIERVAGAIGVPVDEVLQVAAGASARPRFLELERAGVLRPTATPPRPVPVYRMTDAAKFARGSASGAPLGWVVFADDVDEGCFVARIDGAAMEPRIADGSWALFRPLRAPAAAKAIVLAVVGDGEGDVVVRRFDGAGATPESVQLAALHPSHPMLTFRGDGEGRLLAEFVRTVAVEG
jgi:transcriptional regulator with XRE-family HTH domain